MGEKGERGPPGRGPKGLPGATGLPGKCDVWQDEVEKLVVNRIIF